MPTVVITGANGFIGSYLVNYFNRKEWTVRALVHNMPRETVKGVEYHLHNLISLPDKKFFDGADCFIHCAYARNDFNTNVEGSTYLIDMSRECGVKKNIFTSSISAREDAHSVYGRQKWACEKLFNKQDDVIIRPGLVLGNGGLFGQMRAYLKRKRFIPLISGGTQSLQTIYVGDLAEAIFSCIDKNLSGTYTVASTEHTTYKEFYTLLSSTLNKNPRFIFVPYGLLYFMLSITETLGIKLTISRENLRGLKQLHYVDTTEDLKKLGITVKGCRVTLTLISQ